MFTKTDSDGGGGGGGGKDTDMQGNKHLHTVMHTQAGYVHVRKE